MLVTGVVREMTAASAKRAALGAGSHRDGHDRIQRSNASRFEQIQRIRELRPDMILMSGGTDGGTSRACGADRRVDCSGQASTSIRLGTTRIPDHLRRQYKEAASRLSKKTFDESVESHSRGQHSSGAGAGESGSRPRCRFTTCIPRTRDGARAGLRQAHQVGGRTHHADAGSCR